MQLRRRDVDRLGHVNQSVYHELLNEARWRLLGPLLSDDTGFVVVHVELSHHAEVRHADREVEVTARVGRLGVKSVAIEQQVLRTDGNLAAEGRVVLVAWEALARRSRALSERERLVLGEHRDEEGDGDGDGDGARTAPNSA
jgi:acyl-CoA thioester hydrolase